MFDKFILQLYCKSQPDVVTDIPLLRYHLFSKYQKSAEELPPTKGALYQRMLRCHYVTYILKKALEPILCLPEPTQYGWSISSDGKLMANTTDNVPAPASLIELTMCSCTTNCSTNRCKCRKHNLVCTDVCKCEGCENEEQDQYIDKEIILSDDDDY